MIGLGTCKSAIQYRKYLGIFSKMDLATFDTVPPACPI